MNHTSRFKKKTCRFCADSSINVDYKNQKLLQYYISERVKILPSRTTGNCAFHQRELALAIKRARQIAILPYSVDRD